MDDGEVPVLEQFREARAGGIESEMIVRLEHFVLCYGDRRAEVIIPVILERHEGIEAVIAASEFDEHQNGGVLVRGVFTGGPDGVRGEPRHPGAKGDKAGAFCGEGKKLAPGGETGRLSASVAHGGGWCAGCRCLEFPAGKQT